MIKLMLTLSILICATTYATDVMCKKTISIVTEAFGNKLEVDDFSSGSFSDLALSVQDFNDLDNATQKEIFLKIRPLILVASETYSNVFGYLQYVKEDPTVEQKNPGITETLNKFISYLEKHCFTK